MGFLDSVIDKFHGGGKAAGADALAEGLGQSRRDLQPYYEGGLQDYQRYRKDIAGMGDMLSQYGNPMDQFWRDASMNPDDFYDSIMGGYQESNMAKYQQEAAMRAANNGASASGMMGSGAYYDTLQQNAADISQRDMQQFFDNMMNTRQAQYGYGQNFQGQQDQYRRAMGGLADTGFNAAKSWAQIQAEIAAAQQAKEQAKAEGWSNYIGTGLGMLTGGGGMGGGGMGGGMSGGRR